MDINPYLQATQTRDALCQKFGVKDPEKLYERLAELHDITWQIVNAETDQETIGLLDKLDAWYKATDW